MSDCFDVVRCGVGAIILKTEPVSPGRRILARLLPFLPRPRTKVLLGKRKNAHGAGEWSFPGGHQEMGETTNQSAARETWEETGLVIAPEHFRATTFTDDAFPEIGRQYTTFYLVAGLPEGQHPIAREPHKCEAWLWFDWEQLPRPLFSGLEELVRRGFNPARLP